MRRVLIPLLCLFPLAAQTAQKVSKKPDNRGLQVVETLAPAAQGPRVALVIGNGAYKDAPLKNPVSDARAMAEALQQTGFAVTRLENASRAQMRDALRDWGARIAQGGVGLFYFAGHGMQVKGRNYLIPVGSDIKGEDEVATEALELDAILAKMESAKNQLNILVLDACRNNPFARSFRGSQQGLAQIDAPVGTYVAFATAPGRTAADGEGGNGLYTQQLLQQLRRPGLKLEDVFKATRQAVVKASGGAQVPWENSSLMGDFYFLAEGAPVPATPAPALVPSAAVAYLEGREAAQALVKDGFETQAEFEARIQHLPLLKVGVAIPQREKYDLERKSLPLVLSVEPWAARQVPGKAAALTLDRDAARALCISGVELPLLAKAELAGGKVRLSGLTVRGPAGQILQLSSPEPAKGRWVAGIEPGEAETPVGQVVSNYLEAIGGVDALNAIRTFRMRSHVETKGSHSIPVQHALLEVGPEGAIRSEVSGVISILQVVQGQSQGQGEGGWEQVGKDSPRAMAQGTLALLARSQEVLEGEFVHGRDRGEPLTYAGQDPLDGRPAHRLRQTKRVLGQIVSLEYWFDAQTHLLVRILVDPDRPPKERMDTRVSDYRTIGGIKVSFLQVMSLAGMNTTTVVDHLELNPDIDPARFARHPSLK